MSARVIGRGTWLPATRRTSMAAITGQLPRRSGTSIAFPAELGRALGARMAELEADLRLRLGVDEIDDALPGRDVLGVIEPGAAGGDAAFRRHAGHLGEDQAGAAHRALAVVDEVEVVGRAVDRRIHRHRRDGDAVLQARMSRSSNGANIGGAAARGFSPVARFQNQRSTLFEPCAVAQPQVLVADALAARQQRISELQRLEMEIALDVLEPFGRVARAVLELEHFESAARPRIGGAPPAMVGLAVEILGQLDRVFERELGARADREMRGGAASPSRMTLPCDQRSHMMRRKLSQAEPRRWRAFDISRVAVEIFGEELLAGGDRLVLRHRSKPKRARSPPSIRR